MARGNGNIPEGDAEKQVQTNTDSSHSTSSDERIPSKNRNAAHIPALPALHFSFKWSYVICYITFLLFCNLFIPCLLFYLLRHFTPMTTKEIIGISSAALGLSSCFDAPFRLYRLVRYRRTYGPLGSNCWWHLDFVMWTYTFALGVFAFPLAIAPAIGFYDFFLMSTVMLVGPIGLVFALSLLAFKLPCPCSSEPKGACMKPAALYVLEDVAAVDFKHGRSFRKAVHDRWDASPPFRHLMTQITLYGSFATLVYCGVTAAVTWASPLQFAFGWVLGQLFLWAIATGVGCVLLVKRGLKLERDWWNSDPWPTEKKDILVRKS